MPSFLAEHAPQLHTLGYSVVPIQAGKKHPNFKGWQRTQASDLSIRLWSDHFTNGGVGVLTRHTPAIDIDVLDRDIVTELVAWCEKNIGPTLQRIGRAPKILLVYRTDQPFSKLASKKYRDFLGQEHKIEILGDGQQFVAYAKHPNTGKPYQWAWDDGLNETDQKDLVTLTEAQAQALIAYFESIVPDDWEIVERETSSKRVDLSIPEEERILAHAKPKSNASTKQLREALGYLDPDMRMHEWIRIGMGLFHQYDGDEEGFALWDEWSAGGSKYEPDEMRPRWRSFEADLRGTDPVTAATIIHQAKQLRRETKKNQTPLDRFLDRYVLIEHGNKVCDLDKPPHCAVSKLEEFRNATANQRHMVPAPTQKEPDKEKAQPVHFAWLVDKDRKTAQGVRYDPAQSFYFQDKDQGGLWWVNEFHTPQFHRPAGACTKVFYEHMDYLCPVEFERTWLIDWIAFNLQYPHLRSKVTPLHISLAHGTGRGWLVDLMGRLLGQWNCTHTKMDTLAGEGNGGGFQDYLNKSLFCAIEEVREGARRFSISDKIRDVLEAPFLEVNVKFGGKQTQRVFTNFFLMSNHPDALVITKEDRRINVLTGPKKPRDRHYYLRLYGWLETDGVAALYHELMARNLSNFDWQHSVETEARTRMISNNQTETERLFHELLAAPPQPAMLYQQIVNAMLALSEKDAFDTTIEENQLTKLLQHHAEPSNRMAFGGRNGKRGRAWIFDSAIVGDPEAIRAAVEAGSL